MTTEPTSKTADQLNNEAVVDQFLYKQKERWLHYNRAKTDGHLAKEGAMMSKEKALAAMQKYAQWDDYIRIGKECGDDQMVVFKAGKISFQ